MRMAALMKANFLEVRRNPTLILMPVIVIAMSLLYAVMTRSGGPSDMFMFFSLVMGIFMVGTQLPAASFSEDREKRVMEAVFLTPARPLEVIFSKLVVTAVVAVVTAVISVLVFPKHPANPGVLILGYLLTLAFACAVGTAIGLVSPNQKTAGVVGAPIMLVIIFSAMLPWQEFMPSLWKAFTYLPSRPIQELLRGGIEGTPFPLAKDVAILLTYTLLVVGVCARLMRRLASAR